MKNELQTKLTSSLNATVDVSQNITTTFSLHTQVDRSELAPHHNQYVLVTGTLVRYGQCPAGKTALIAPAMFHYGDIHRCITDVPNQTIDHAWLLIEGQEDEVESGASIGGRAKVILYARNDGTMSYGFQLQQSASYFNALKGALLNMIVDLDQHYLPSKSVSSFVIKSFIDFDKWVASHKDVIATHGLGINACKRMRERVERTLLKVLRHSPSEFSKAVGSALDWCETVVEENAT